MADLAVDSLRENEHIKELLELLSQLDERDKTEDFSNLLLTVDSMEMQFNKVLKDLQEVKTQLARLQKSPVKQTLAGMMNRVEYKIQETRTKLNEIKAGIIEGVEKTMQNVKYMGLASLNKMLSLLGVRQALENMCSNLEQAGKMIDHTIVKLGEVGQELRGAGQYISNAGHILIGKERQEVSANGQKSIASAVLTPMRNTRNILNSMEKNVAYAVDRLEHLEQAPVKMQSIMRSSEEQPSQPQSYIEYRAHVERDFAECKEYLEHYEEMNGQPNHDFETAIKMIHDQMLAFAGFSDAQLEAISKLDEPLTEVYGYLVGTASDNPFRADEVDAAIRDVANTQICLWDNEQYLQELNDDMEQ